MWNYPRTDLSPSSRNGSKKMIDFIEVLLKWRRGRRLHRLVTWEFHCRKWKEDWNIVERDFPREIKELRRNLKNCYRMGKRKGKIKRNNNIIQGSSVPYVK